MAHVSVTELQQMARDTFARDLTAEQAEAYRARLPVMVQAVQLVQAWEPRLRASEPAAVHHTPVSGGEAYGT